MFSNAPINDDWIFLRQIEAFDLGIFTLSKEIDPSFILQGLLGFVWGKLFGISFLSLQVLTFLITLLGVYALYLIFKELEIPRNFIVLALLLYFFNPLVFASAFTFMSDNYFLTFLLFSLFFYVKFLKTLERRNLLFAGIFTFLSILVRQTGILTFFAFSAVFTYIYVLNLKTTIDQKFNLEYIFRLLQGVKLRFLDSTSVYTQIGFKKYIKNVGTLTLFVFSAYLIYSTWPTYGNNRTFILLTQIPERLYLMLLALLYFVVFMFPLMFLIKLWNFNFAKIKRNPFKFIKQFAPFALLFVFFYKYFYGFDLFPLGNVLYIEDLYTKSNFRSNFSLFDNVVFKSFMSLVFSYSVSTFIYYFAKALYKTFDSNSPFDVLKTYISGFFTKKVVTAKTKKIFWLLNFLQSKNESTQISQKTAITLFLIATGIFNYLILLISSDIYDRYLLPSFVCFLIAFLYNNHSQFVLNSVDASKNFRAFFSTNKLLAALTLLLIFISLVLQWEYSQKNNLMYKQAFAISEQTGAVKQISLNDTYLNYAISKAENDYTGTIERKSFEYKCFVQDYTLDSENSFFKSLARLHDNVTDKYFDNPKPYNFKKKNNLPRVKKNLDKLIYNDEYFSPLYNFVGKRAFVGSWCLQDSI